MDKNVPNDPLEDFFKKSLEGMSEQPADDGWDVPSSKVWDRVEATIPPTAKIRPLNYWKWTAVAASVAVFFLAYQWINQGQQIENLTTELAQKNEKLENVEVIAQALEKQKAAAETSFAQDNKTNNEEESDLEKMESAISIEESQRANPTNISNSLDNATSFSGKNESGIGGKNNASTPQLPTLENENIANNSSNNILIFNEEKAKTANQNAVAEIIENTTANNFSPTKIENSNTGFSKNKKIQTIEILPNRLFTIDEKEILKHSEIDLPVAPIIDLMPPKSQSGLYVGAFSSYNLGHLKIKAEDNPIAKDRKNRIKNNHQKEDWTLGGGLKIGYQFNKNWSIESGVQYTKSNSQHQHRLDKNFDSNNEILNGTELEGDYAMLLVTSIGDVESDATLSRPMSMPLPNQQSFGLEVETEQNISFVGIPILAKYSTGNQKWNIGMKAGMLTNFVTQADVEIIDVRSQLPQLQHRRHRVPDKKELENLKSTTFDWMAGVELEMKLNKSTSISLEPSFSKSMTPIFEKKNVETFPMMASVKVGVSYQF